MPRFSDIRRFATIDSTNRYVLECAATGAADGLVAVADEQTAGRGRLGRSWIAPPGAALLVSVLLRPALPADRMHLVTLAAALALVDVVPEDARVKWPNDVVVGDRKLAGILAEADGGGAVVVGMGCNVRSDWFPVELRDVATATSLERDELLDAWLTAFDARLGTLDGVVDDARARSATIGRHVRVELPSETFEGTATALTAEGYLVVADRVVTAADVVHLR
jgi:BirA family biotin operon repressor/biotin-[acetyl-CoA-carboxylase] ligase